MTDIREQIKGAKIFAALSMTKPTHHLCGIKIELLADTMENLLVVYEAAKAYHDICTIENCKLLRIALASVQTRQESCEHDWFTPEDSEQIKWGAYRMCRKCRSIG